MKNKEKKTPRAAGGGRGRHQALTGDVPHYPRARAASQCERLARYLTEHGAITTIEARERLRIMHPGGRVLDLRDAGWPIKLTWLRVFDRAGEEHLIGRYVLGAGGWNE